MELGRVENLSSMPAPLHGHISAQQWESILGKFRKTRNDAVLMACGGEIFCAFVTGFICIFCCHPIINNALLDKTLGRYGYLSYYSLSIILVATSTCADINRTYFSGNRVFASGSDGTLVLNVHSIPSVQPYPVATAMAYSSVQPYNSSYAHSPMYVPPAEQYVTPSSPGYAHAPAQSSSKRYYEEEEPTRSNFGGASPTPQMGQVRVPSPPVLMVCM